MLARSRSIHLILVALLATLALLIPIQPAHAADTEIAHLWRFEYQQASGQGKLEIKIVEHDKDTHEIIEIFEQFDYAVPCSQNGLAISCELDIKSAIQDAYYQLDLIDEIAKVRSAEAYRWMRSELTGSWHTIVAKSHYAVVSHPSLHVAVETHTNGTALRYKNQWNTHTATSPYFRPQLSTPQTLVNDFNCPSAGLCVSTNYVVTKGSTKVLNSQQINSSSIGFQLTPNQLLITPPPGFQLNSFVIDPPKAGYG